MHKTRHLFAILCLICLFTAPAHAEGTDPDLIEPSSDRPAAVPMVPLPTAFYGSLASVGVMVALWNSRHRHWLTLR
jgi:hypothetical protein